MEADSTLEEQRDASQQRGQRNFCNRDWAKDFYSPEKLPALAGGGSWEDCQGSAPLWCLRSKNRRAPSVQPLIAYAAYSFLCCLLQRQYFAVPVAASEAGPLCRLAGWLTPP